MSIYDNMRLSIAININFYPHVYMAGISSKEYEAILAQSLRRNSFKMNKLAGYNIDISAAGNRIL